jgi:hypothetical protein
MVDILTKYKGVELHFAEYDHDPIMVFDYNQKNDMLSFKHCKSDGIMSLLGIDDNYVTVDSRKLAKAITNIGYTVEAVNVRDLSSEDRSDIDHKCQCINYIINNDSNHGLYRLFVDVDSTKHMYDEVIKSDYTNYNYLMRMTGTAKNTDAELLKITAGMDYELMRCEKLVFKNSDTDDDFSTSPYVMTVSETVTSGVYEAYIYCDGADEYLSMINSKYGKDRATGYLYDIAKVVKNLNLYLATTL